MKKILLTFITAALLVAAVVGLTSCSKKTKFDELDKAGYTVSVTFDPCGGNIKGSDSTIIDAFNPAEHKVSDTTAEIALLSPDSALRDKNNILTVSKPEHFLAGWYTERTPVDENDLSKGYTYSGKWDFDNDKITVDLSKEYTSAESVLTLYAAWIPYYNFEIYADVNGEQQLLNTVSTIDLDIPKWTENGVTIAMGNFPVREGYTLECVYADEEYTSPVTTESYSGSWDVATGTSLTPTIKLYTTWLEGNRYRIYSAEDLRKNADRNGWYDLYADLDFTDVNWPAIFTSGSFSGVINGNGHTISGVKVTSEGNKQTYGIFSALSATARLTNVSFENITHTFNAGRVMAGASVGLLAGEIDAAATLTGVSVSGKLVFGDNCNNLKNADFTIGKLCAFDEEISIDTSNIVCEPADSAKCKFEIVIEDGEVKLQFT